MQAGFCAVFLQPLFCVAAEEMELCINQRSCAWGVSLDPYEGQTCFFCCGAPGKWGRKKLFVCWVEQVEVWVLFCLFSSYLALICLGQMLCWDEGTLLRLTRRTQVQEVPTQCLSSGFPLLDTYRQGQGSVVLSNGRTWLSARCNLNSFTNYCR